MLRFFGRQLDAHATFPRAGRSSTTHDDFARRRAIEAAHQHDRFRIEEIGQVIATWKYIVDTKRWIDREFNVGQHRRIDATHQAINHGIRIVRERDDFAHATSRTRHFFEQEAVDAVADTETEDARRTRVVAHRLHNRLVISDVAIGQEEDESCARVGIFKSRALRNEDTISIACFPCAINKQCFTLRARWNRNLDNRANRAAFTRVHRPTVRNTREFACIHNHANRATIRRKIKQLRGLHAAATFLDERRVDRGHHLGSARAIRAINKHIRRALVLFGCRLWFRPKHARRASKRHHVERVVCAHASDRFACERL